MNNLDVTVNFEFLQELPEDADIAILEGSTRSGKTVGIAQWLLLYAVNNPGTLITCFRHNAVTHTKTTIKDLKLAFQLQGKALGIDTDTTNNYWHQAGKWNKQEKVYRFKNGSEFTFAGTMDIDTLHGFKQHIAWLNEVMEIAIDAYSQISFRTTKLTIMDFNPSLNHHWVFKQILTQEKGVYHLRTTYLDNPFLTNKQVREIEKYDPSRPENVLSGTADQWKWDVYGLGKRGRVEGAIYKLWEICEEWPDPSLCHKWGYGMDFGYSDDPSALGECALFQGNLYLRERMYEKELLITPNLSDPSIPSIETRLKENRISKNAKIVADNARPEAIADLQTSGYNVHPCVKGKGSVLEGIDLVKSRKIFVYKNSMNLQMELEHYTWKRKIDGTWLREPIDNYNHLLDAIRYWSSNELELARTEEKVAHGKSTGRSSFKSKSNIRSRRLRSRR